MADLCTLFYTDYQSPDWSWVLELEGRLVGYLMGCPDTARFSTIMDRQIIPRVLLGALRRGSLFRSGTAGFLWRLLRDLVLDRPRHGFYDPKFPAHAHLNVLPEGRGATFALVTRFVHALQHAGVHGVMAEIWGENTAMKELLLAHGFQPVYGAPLPGLRQADGKRYHELILVRTIPINTVNNELHLHQTP